MRIPNYYCPHCKRFKRFFQVDRDDGYNSCKHCGTPCNDVEEMLKDYVEQELSYQNLIGSLRNESKNSKVDF